MTEPPTRPNPAQRAPIDALVPDVLDEEPGAELGASASPSLASGSPYTVVDGGRTTAENQRVIAKRNRLWVVIMSTMTIVGIATLVFGIINAIIALSIGDNRGGVRIPPPPPRSASSSSSSSQITYVVKNYRVHEPLTVEQLAAHVVEALAKHQMQPQEGWNLHGLLQVSNVVREIDGTWWVIGEAGNPPTSYEIALVATDEFTGTSSSRTRYEALISLRFKTAPDAPERGIHFSFECSPLSTAQPQTAASEAPSTDATD